MSNYVINITKFDEYFEKIYTYKKEKKILIQAYNFQNIRNCYDNINFV